MFMLSQTTAIKVYANENVNMNFVSSVLNLAKASPVYIFTIRK